MTRFLCARCGQPKDLMHVTCRECEEALQARIYELERVSDEFLVGVAFDDTGVFHCDAPKICGLCGNTGKITTRVNSPAGAEGGLTDAPCICPNGRAIKEKMDV